MRRPAAALAAILLASVLLTGPLASAGQAGPSSNLSCAGATPPPACALVDQLAAQLAPLQPVLALAGPVLAQVVPAAQGLATQADQPGGVPTAVVTAQAQALLDQLNVLPAPVRDLLGVAQLGGLTDTLEALVAALAAPAAGRQTGEAASPPIPAQTGSPSSPPTRSTASGTPTLGGSLAGPGNAGQTLGTTTSPPIPGVPLGDSLTFAPLALPDFGFDPTIGLDASAAPAADDAATAQVADASMVKVPNGGTETGLGIVAGLSILLLGAALAAHVREARHIIPD